MTRMVQLALAGDINEAEEIQGILAAAGIDSELQSAQDEPLTVVVPESSLEDAKEAIEALTEPDEIIAEP
jgi:cell division protein FtsN